MDNYLEIFRNLHLPVLILDVSSRITAINKSALGLFINNHNKGLSDFDAANPSDSIRNLNDCINKILADNGGKQVFEAPLNTNTGKLNFKISLNKLPDCCSIISFEDITTLRETENMLLERELQYNSLANAGKAMIWRSGTDKLCNYFNDIWLNFTGRKLEEEVGNGWCEGVHPDDLEDCVATYCSAFDKREPFEMEYRIRHATGEYRWILDIGTPNFDRWGNFAGYIGHCFDISQRKNQEEILRRSEEKYRNLFEEDLTGNFVTDSIGTVLDCNSSFLEIFGFNSRDEIIGKSILGLYEDEEEAEQLKQELQKNKFIKMRETTRKRKDGKSIHVVENIVAEFYADGTIKEIKCHLFDITSRKLLESSLQESETIARTLLNISDKIIILLDAVNYNVIDLNDFAAFRLKSRTTDIIGKCLFDFPMFNHDDLKIADIKEISMNGVPVDFEIEWERRFYSCQFFPIITDEGEVSKIAIFSDDITNIKKTEENLKQLNQELSETNRTKDKLFSVIAHDLRSPIASIINFSEMIGDNIDKYETSTLKEYIRIINNISESTIEMLDNLLIWSGMQSGRFEFNPSSLELKKVVHEIYKILQPSASLKIIDLKYFITDDHVFADPDMLKTVIRNLVQNAIKFTNPGGHVVIRNTVTAHHVEVTVTDDGVGMNKEMQEKLFQSGIVSRRGTADERGSGLGLILCKDFIEKHGGTLSVNSAEGSGSEFRFTLRKDSLSQK